MNRTKLALPLSVILIVGILTSMIVYAGWAPVLRGIAAVGATRALPIIAREGDERSPLLPAILPFNGADPSRLFSASPAQEIRSAWKRARASGSYTFHGEITQAAVPEARITNLGKTSQGISLYVQGEADLSSGDLTMKIWAQGGSLVNPKSAVEYKVENGVAQMRQGGVWKSSGDLTGSLIPGGDFMSFLDSARDIVKTSQVDANDAPTIYTYQIDGPRFATQMHSIIQQGLARQGKLPPNLELVPSSYLRKVTGQGKFWVDARGLPLRQMVHLVYP